MVRSQAFRGKCWAGPWNHASLAASLLLAYLLVLASLVPLNAARQLLVTSPESASLAPRKVRVGLYSRPYQRAPYGLNFTEGVKVASWNSGNRIWSYGAERLFDPSAVEWVSGDEVRGDPRKVPQNGSAHNTDGFLLGTANLFFNESVYERVRELTHVYMNLIRAFNAPTVMVGLGAQADFGSGMQLGAAAGANGQETELKPAAFAIHREQKELYMMIKNTTGEVTVRGAFTADAIVANGLPPPLVLGCPSLFINHDPNLGASLEARRNAVLAARDYDNLRLAIGLPHIPSYWHLESRPLVRLIAERILKVFPKSFVVIQTPEDHSTIRQMHEYGVDLGPERVKYFYDPEHWIEAIRDSADFLFNFRIHGTMAGTAAGVPAVVISTDHRIAELAEAMRLPHTRLQDRGFDVQPFDVFNFVATVPFDGKAFDQRRVEIAKQYAQVFERLKLPLNPGIGRIAAGNVSS